MLVGVPIAAVAMSIADQIHAGHLHVDGAGLRPLLLLKSLSWAAGITMLATLLAWPVAWSIRRHGLVVLPIVLLPMLAPSYLAYHSLGIHRAPLTKLGDFIEWLAKPADLGGHGWTELPTLVGHALAIVGLSLWVWPVAALVLSPGLARLDQSMLDAARLQGASWMRVQWEVLRLQWRSVFMAFGVVTLLMLGSAAPMHLAQAPTYAITAWQSIVLDPTSLAPWISSWPLFVLIGVIALLLWLLAGRAEESYSPTSDDAGHSSEHDRIARDQRSFITGFGRPVRASNLWTLSLLAMSVLVPLATYLISLKRWSSVKNFWMVSQDAIALSAIVGAIVGVSGAALFIASWAIAAGQSRQGGAQRRLLKGLALPAALLMIGALTPSIMVGHAWRQVLGWATRIDSMDWLRDSLVPISLAHLSRFAIIPVFAGAFYATLEPASLRDARTLMATSPHAMLRGWIRAELARGWGAAFGLGIALACLSIHEVESSIVIQPAGTSSLPQTILAQLHFARQEEMAAAAIVVLTPAALTACVGLFFLCRKAK